MTRELNEQVKNGVILELCEKGTSLLAEGVVGVWGSSGTPLGLTGVTEDVRFFPFFLLELGGALRLLF